MIKGEFDWTTDPLVAVIRTGHSLHLSTAGRTLPQNRDLQPVMRVTVAENFRAVFYAPFYALRALDLAAREGLAIDWLPGERPGGAVEDVKRGRIDALFGGPMRALHDHDSGDGALICFAEVVGRDPFCVVGRKESFQLADLASMRLG